MGAQTAVPRQPSWSRIGLLLTLGVTVSVAFTQPGNWAAERVLSPLIACPAGLRPILMLTAMGDESRDAQALRVFRDVGHDGSSETEAQPAPTPELVAARLASIDGWSTAVLFECFSSPYDLYAAGLDDATTCVLLAGNRMPPRFPRPDFGWYRSGPVRTWRLVMLDAAGRQVACLSLCARRAGFELSRDAATGENVYVPAPAAPGDEPLPSIAIFHRSATGEVRTG